MGRLSGDHNARIRAARSQWAGGGLYFSTLAEAQASHRAEEAERRSAECLSATAGFRSSVRPLNELCTNAKRGGSRRINDRLRAAGNDIWQLIKDKPLSVTVEAKERSEMIGNEWRTNKEPLQG